MAKRLRSSRNKTNQARQSPDSNQNVGPKTKRRRIDNATQDEPPGPPNYLCQLSQEVLCEIMEYLPIWDVMKLESMCRHLRESVALHLRLITDLDFTEGDIYGWMPSGFCDNTFKRFISRLPDLIYIYGLHSENLSVRRHRGSSKLSIPGIIEALQLCLNLHGVETSNIFLLEAILVYLPSVKIISGFKNRVSVFPMPPQNSISLPRNPMLTSLHLCSVELRDLPRMDCLKRLYLKWVRFTDPHPFKTFAMPKLRSFVMNNCAGPLDALKYVPLMTGLAAARSLSRLELVRVPFLGGLIHHVVEDSWRLGGLRNLHRILLGACKHAQEPDLGFLTITSATKLEELFIQPSLTKDSFFHSLSLSEPDFPKMISLYLGYVDDFPEPGKWSQEALKEQGLAEYSENPALLTDIGMKYVDQAFPKVSRLSMYNCPHVHYPTKWIITGNLGFAYLTELTLNRCHAMRLEDFCNFLGLLPCLEHLTLKMMFKEPPKGCSRVGLSAGTGLGVAPSMVSNAGSAGVANNNAMNNPTGNQHVPQANQNVVHGPQPANQNPVYGPQPANQNQAADQQLVEGPQPANQGPVHGPQLANQDPVEGPQPANQDPVDGPQLANQDPVEGPQLANQDPVEGPQLANQDLVEGPQLANQDPVVGPRPANQDPVEGSQLANQDPIEGPQPANQDPIEGPQPPNQNFLHGHDPAIQDHEAKPGGEQNSSPNNQTSSHNDKKLSKTSSKLSSSTEQDCTNERNSDNLKTMNEEKVDATPSSSGIVSNSCNKSDREHSHDSSRTSNMASSSLDLLSGVYLDSTDGDEDVFEDEHSSGNNVQCPSLQASKSNPIVNQVTSDQNSTCDMKKQNRDDNIEPFNEIESLGPEVSNREGKSSDEDDPCLRLDLEGTDDTMEAEVSHGVVEIEGYVWPGSDCCDMTEGSSAGESWHGSQEVILGPDSSHQNLTGGVCSVDKTEIDDVNAGTNNPSSSSNSACGGELCFNDEMGNQQCGCDVDDLTSSESSAQIPSGTKSDISPCPECNRKVSESDRQSPTSHGNRSQSNDSLGLKGKGKSLWGSKKGIVNKSRHSSAKVSVSVSKSCQTPLGGLTLENSKPGAKNGIVESQPVTCDVEDDEIVNEPLCESCMKNDNSSVPLSKSPVESVTVTSRHKDTRDQATDTNDPLIEQDHKQVLLIKSRSLKSLSLHHVGVTHLVLPDCPKLKTITASACRVLRTIDVNLAPRLDHVSFAQCPKLDHAKLLAEICTLPPENHRLVFLRPGSNYSRREIENLLFSTAGLPYHMCLIHDHSHIPRQTLYNRTRVAAWPDVINNIHQELMKRDAGIFCRKPEDMVRLLGDCHPFRTGTYYWHGASENGAALDMVCDIPWLQTLATELNQDNANYLSTDDKVGIYSPSAKGHCSLHGAMEALEFEVAEVRETRRHLYMYPAIVYVNLCDRDSVVSDLYV